MTTPGPWFDWISKDKTSKPFVTGNDTRICDVHTNDADAKLIASAPLLLEALKEARERIGEMLDWFGRPGREEWNSHESWTEAKAVCGRAREELARIDSAIAAATRET